MNALPALDRKLLRDLWHIRMQVIAIAVVIACGVATVVMARGVLTSLALTLDAYYERQAFGEVFSHLTRAPVSTARRIAALPGVASVDHRIAGRAIIEVAGAQRPAIGQLVSLPEFGARGLNRVFLRSGRLPRSGNAGEAVISESFANAHRLTPGSTVLAVLNGKRRELRIVGIGLSPEFIYAVGPGQIIPDDSAFGVLWLERAALEAAFDLRGAFNDVSLSLLRGTNEEAVIAGVDDILANYGGLGAYGREDQISHAFVTSELHQLETMARVFPPIFLGVAAFLLHIVLSRLMDTEREQIGLMKAFGYSDGAVGVHYLKMALFIAAIGAAAGAALGLWMGRSVTAMYTRFFHFPYLQFQTEASVLMIAVAAALAAAVAGTWLAVYRIARLAPAVAMQPRAPVVYGRTVGEKLRLLRWFTPSTRMAWRHVIRWPMRSTLTSAGIGASVGLMVGSLFPFDSIDLMIDVVYFRAQRQDVLVAFDHQRTERALYDIARLPGVMRAEPVYSVAAALVSGPVRERVAIAGRPPDSRLSMLLDSDLRPVETPPRGLVLSKALAEKLRVRPGDMVRLEVLEGKRRKAPVRVAAIVEEYVGLSAYMAATALDEITRDGGAITGARLAVDSTKLDALYREVAEIPAVAGIAGRDMALEAFRSILAESMNIVLIFYVGFAAAITVGVIYNSARIALSERARELATLRVLGFHDREAAAVLLGEFAILSLLALPIGFAFGWGLAKFMTTEFATDLFRMPMVISLHTYVAATLVGLGAAGMSGYVVARRITRFDLVAVLKTRD